MKCKYWKYCHFFYYECWKKKKRPPMEICCWSNWFPWVDQPPAGCSKKRSWAECKTVGGLGREEHVQCFKATREQRKTMVVEEVMRVEQECYLIKAVSLLTSGKAQECKEAGWTATIHPVEECRGFVGKAATSLCCWYGRDKPTEGH